MMLGLPCWLWRILYGIADVLGVSDRARYRKRRGHFEPMP